MLPQDKDLILKDKVKLYNNLGKINDCEGRLSAELEVYPTPRIVWEFEMLGDVTCNFPNYGTWKTEGSKPVIGHNFYIEKYLHLGDFIAKFGSLKATKGITEQALYGDIEAEAHEFVFYVPNVIVHHKTKFSTPTKLIKRVIDLETNLAIGEDYIEAHYVDFAIDDIWAIQLQVRQDALEWLDEKHRNTGTLITTFGILYQQKREHINNFSELQIIFPELKTLTLNHAVDRLKKFSKFLSFANGGYTTPLYIEGEKYTQNNSPQETSCAVALVSQTTPVEQLGKTWVAASSNLKLFMECFPSFERMIQNLYWQNTFDFVLNQYFQATKPDMTWEIKASAAGAALERLCYTILVEEETDTTKKDNYKLLFDFPVSNEARRVWGNCPKYKKTDGKSLSMVGIRLSLLLERIGLVSDINPDNIQSFSEVRNDAVHPRVGGMTIGQRWKLINQAIQWIDEVLLWRFGYNGEYLDRIKGMETPTNPRYDLSLRDSSW